MAPVSFRGGCTVTGQPVSMLAAAAARRMRSCAPSIGATVPTSPMIPARTPVSPTPQSTSETVSANSSSSVLAAVPGGWALGT